MIIRELKVKKPYRYLWLKHITGVNLTEHCARSFRGVYSRQVTRFVHEYRDIVLPEIMNDNSPFIEPPCQFVAHYLCGVLNYVDNLHLAMLNAPGERAEVHDDKCDFVLEDGVLVPIREDYIPQGFANAERPCFRTCRNWQFAHWLRNTGRA